MLSVFVLSVIMLSVVMLNVVPSIMLGIIVLSVTIRPFCLVQYANCQKPIMLSVSIMSVLAPLIL
jgi:hypothetical protein